MNKEQNKCIIWGTPLLQSKEVMPRTFPPKWEYDSPRAGGKYCIDERMRLAYHSPRSPSFSKEEKIRLSAYIAQENLNSRIPNLTEVIKDENRLEKLNPTPDDPGEKADLLLKGLAALYPDKGMNIVLNINKISHPKNNPLPFLYALSYSSSKYDFRFLLFDILEEELKYIKIERHFGGSITDIKITLKGWKKIEGVESKVSNKNSKKAFIAMWIKKPSKRTTPKQSIRDQLKTLKKGIEKAIRNSGYESLRIDDKKHTNIINNEILSEIQSAKFVVCDIILLLRM